MQMARNDILAAWTTMVRIRAFEECLVKENRTGDIPGLVHLYIGQEAIATGVCAHLNDSDYITSTHRGHGHALAKGVNAKAMMAEIFGRSDGLCGGKGGSMHLADPTKGHLGANGIVGANAPLALGAAISAKTLKTGAVAVTFNGDGASNQGAVFESMNMAAAMDLPILFVIEQNGYGEFTPSADVTGTDNLADRARAFGMEAHEVEGTDFFAVHDLARTLIEKARAGSGPATLVATAPRLGGHHDGDEQAYRPAGELSQEQKEQDCIRIFHDRITKAGLLDVAELDAIRRDAELEMSAAASAARLIPPPPLSALLTDIVHEA